MKFGIMGGTFDPIHLGHLRIAEEICHDLDLEKVYLIPGSLPPHKDMGPITPFDDRLAMVKIAAQDSPCLEVLDLEGRRQGFSYTIETLKEIHRVFKPDPELFFILGTDAFLEITTWKEYTDLFKYTNFVVIKRPGYSDEKMESFVRSLGVGFEKRDDNCFINSAGNLLIKRKATLMDISSTSIRDMTDRGISIRFLVTEPVRSYIIKKGLYNFHENSR